MGLIVKTLLAFCIGVGAMAGLQTLWVSSVTQQLHSQPAVMPQVQMKGVI